ncbi:protealysin inhibitor emfourin [Massilia aurea]|uniref:protealysin inhibitor emfourin n=1 Tax=Massilia aurea TaxID=373040 RepID=UPI00346192C6
MKISARADGGFSGLAESYELDTARLAVGPALEALLQRLDFFGAAPAAAFGAALGVDIPRWEITIDDGARRHTVALQEDGSCGEWQDLLAQLRQAA